MKCLDHIDMAVLVGAVATIGSAALLFAYLGVEREPSIPRGAGAPTTFLEEELEKSINEAVVTPAYVVDGQERAQVALGQAILGLIQAKARDAMFVPDVVKAATADARVRREFLEGVFKLPADWRGPEFAMREREATARAQEALGRTLVTGAQLLAKETEGAEARYGRAVLNATLADRRAVIEPAASQATMIAAAQVMTELAKRTRPSAEPVITRDPRWGFGSIGDGMIVPLMILGAGVVWLLVAGTGMMMMEYGTSILTVAAYCDVHDKDVVIETLVSDDTPYEVIHCSAFNGGPVTCDKHCLTWPLAHAA